MNSNSTAIQEAASILQDAREAITAKLKFAGLNFFADVTNSQLKEIERRFYGMSGLPEDKTVEVKTEFEPLTKIMGRDVTRKAVLKEDLQPTLSEKEQLRNRIVDLHDRIPDMYNDKVLEILYEPKGRSILRGVAKLAGVEDWREAELTVEFVDKIKTAIEAEKKVDKAVKDADKSGKIFVSGELEDDLEDDDDDATGDATGDDTDTDDDEVETSTTKAERAKLLKEEGLTHAEIAEELGIPKGSVGHLLKKAE